MLLWTVLRQPRALLRARQVCRPAWASSLYQGAAPASLATVPLLLCSWPSHQHWPLTFEVSQGSGPGLFFLPSELLSAQALDYRICADESQRSVRI